MPTTTLSLAVRLEDYDLRLEVEHPRWLLARTYKMLGKVGMFVSKSVMLADDDPWLAPVQEFLGKCRAELIRDSEVETPNFFGGKVEWKFYLIHRKDGAPRGMDIDPAFIEEIRVECERLINEVTKEAS
jgi:hypothetical protein